MDFKILFFSEYVVLVFFLIVGIIFWLIFFYIEDEMIIFYEGLDSGPFLLVLGCFSFV